MPDLGYKNTECFVYDAFVIYNSKSVDKEFVGKMIDNLEGPGSNLRLFIPGRDDRGLDLTDATIRDIIQNRCRRCIVILSKNFAGSEVACRQLHFIHSISPAHRERRILPVMIDPCPIPDIVRNLTACDYCKVDLRVWFWKRLSSAISTPIRPTMKRHSILYLPDIVIDTTHSTYKFIGRN